MKDDNVCIILGSSILDSLGNAHSNTLKYLVLISALCIRGSAAALATSSLAEFGPLPHRPEAKGYNSSGLHGIRRVNPLKKLGL